MNIDRAQAEKIAKEKSARANMMQHAKKLIQGFESLDDSHARRAIWELVQNACDLSKNCEITIDFSNEGFAFSHNGKPFTSETLISLVKQVSSKSSVNQDEVGQFGTGFITTHSFGKKFTINSSLKEEGYYISIDDFLVDRQAKNEDELLDKLVAQEEDVYTLIREGTESDAAKPTTIFRYLPETEQARLNIKQASENLHDYIPLVLTFNSSLKAVTVINPEGTVVKYLKGEEETEGAIVKTPIIKNGESFIKYSLLSEDKTIRVILPISTGSRARKISSSLAKLFLYFPLIGTEQWGCNFIIHSTSFAPTEPRDSVHLKSKNDQIQEKEELNRSIIEKASQMIFNFVEQYADLITDPLNLAHITFDTITHNELLNSYFRELKTLWVNKFKEISLVETESGRIAPKDVAFIASELLQDSAKYDSIYQLVSKFWGNKLPKKDIIQNWTSIIDNWGDSTIEKVTIEKLVQKIEEQRFVTPFNEVVLRDFYQYLIGIGKSDLFIHHNLLPNIKQEFIKRDSLVKPVNIPANLIGIADTIAPEIPKRFVKQEYEFDLDFTSYRRENLSKELNTPIYSSASTLTSTNLLSEPFRNALLRMCSIFPVENSTSIRRQVVPLICSFYGLQFAEVIIPNVEDDRVDYEYTPYRAIIKNFLLDIVGRSKSDPNWVETNLNFLKNILSLVANQKVLEDILQTIPVFPNQNYELRLQGDLFKEIDFPSIPEDAEFLKDIYKGIDDIRKDLVHNGFANLLLHHNTKTAFELSSRLEVEFKKHPFEKITEHPHKKNIFEIIQKITDHEEWGKLFTHINSSKALIMMAKISDDEVKNDLFSIIGLEDSDKIAALGKLSKSPDLEKIIELGQKAVEDQQRNEADFAFKKMIGVHIEDLIRNRLSEETEAFKIDVVEQQNGQDMVVKVDGLEVYYIEVKSRWSSDRSVVLSHNQVKNSVKNKNCYALCSVDMSDYNPADGSRYKVTDISNILDRILFLPTIGEQIAPLISNAVDAEKSEDKVKLYDDYRAIVPQPIISAGIKLEKFVDHLISALSLNKEETYA